MSDRTQSQIMAVVLLQWRDLVRRCIRTPCGHVATEKGRMADGTIWTADLHVGAGWTVGCPLPFLCL